MTPPDVESKRRELIIEYVKNHPGPIVDEVAKATGMSRNVATKVLRELEAEGILTRTPGLARSIRLVTSGDSGEVSALQALVGDQAREIERLWALLEEYKADRMRLIWARARLKEMRCRVVAPDGEVLAVPAVDDLRGPGVSFEMLTNYSER